MNIINITTEKELLDAVDYWHTHETGNSLQEFLRITNKDNEYWLKHTDEEFVKYLKTRDDKNEYEDDV